MDDILQDLTPLEQRGKVTRFLNSAKDVDKLSGLVEDIRDAVMDYQVRPWVSCSHLIPTFVPDVLTTGDLLPAHRECHSLIVLPHVVTR